MSVEVVPSAPVVETPPNTPTAGEKAPGPVAETTPEAPTTSEQETPTEEGQPEKPKKADGGFQRRINRLTADYREAQARAQAAEAKAQELERKLTTPASTAGGDEPKPPRLEDFRSYEEYERADRQFIADKATRDAEKRFREAERERTEKTEREAQARRLKEAAERFNKSAEAVSEHYEDFAEVMDDLWRGRIPVIRENDAIAQYLIEESDRGPEVAYHLANNPDVADRLGKLSPLAQVKELVKLEASLPKPNAPATKAPPPPKQVGARGGSDAKDPAKMTIDEMRRATGTKRKVDY